MEKNIPSLFVITRSVVTSKLFHSGLNRSQSSRALTKYVEYKFERKFLVFPSYFYLLPWEWQPLFFYLIYLMQRTVKKVSNTSRYPRMI